MSRRLALAFAAALSRIGRLIAFTRSGANRLA